MSKAFTKEEIEIPERSGRMRHPGGLPAGAVNYMTAEGERRLRRELEELLLQGSAGASGGGELKDERAGDRVSELQRALASATIVPIAEPPPEEALFGATVTLRGADGRIASYRIVGVDETALESGWVSWVSPLAKALIGSRPGARVRLTNTSEDEEMEVVKIAY
ncbi:MAG: GreA/GreB family elongation factor [Verrucomicrobiales bacterium]